MEKKMRVYGFSGQKFKIWFDVRFEPYLISEEPKKKKSKKQFICPYCRREVLKGQGAVSNGNDELYCCQDCMKQEKELERIFKIARKEAKRLNHDNGYYAAERMTKIKIRERVFEL